MQQPDGSMTTAETREALEALREQLIEEEDLPGKGDRPIYGNGDPVKVIDTRGCEGYFKISAIFKGRIKLRSISQDEFFRRSE